MKFLCSIYKALERNIFGKVYPKTSNIIDNVALQNVENYLFLYKIHKETITLSTRVCNETDAVNDGNEACKEHSRKPLIMLKQERNT